MQTIFVAAEKGGLTMPKFKNPLVQERKPPKEPIYNISKSQLERAMYEEYRRGRLDGVYITNAMYSAAMLFELHDTLGWNLQRLRRIFDRVQKLFRSICDRTVKYSEIAEVLRDECKINLVIEGINDKPTDALDVFLSIDEEERKQYAVRIR